MSFFRANEYTLLSLVIFISAPPLLNIFLGWFFDLFRSDSHCL